jgi:hypothetical protein
MAVVVVENEWDLKILAYPNNATCVEDKKGKPQQVHKVTQQTEL